jgi:tRNA modification GTPase
MLAHRKYNCSVTLLTPRGRGAIASVQMNGPDARNMVEGFLIPPASGPLWISGRHLLRKWRISSECTEEVVLWCQSDRLCEIHCHGGVAVVGTIIQQLLAAGAEQGTWIDACAEGLAYHEREAAELLPRAPSRLSATRLLEQIQGALSNEIEHWRKLVIEAKYIEVIQRVQALMRLRHVAAHLTVPWQVVIAGAPNAGKSCLINQFLGYERSIVFDEPGTTRDVLRASRKVDGWEVEFVDTAGIRDSDDPLEMAGCNLGRTAWQKGDLRIVVFDAAACDASGVKISEGWEYPFGPGYPATDLILANKIDLLPASASVSFAAPAKEILPISALKGSGCDVALERIRSLLVPIELADGQPLFVNARQAAVGEVLMDAVQACDQELALQAIAAFSRPDSEQSFDTSE